MNTMIKNESIAVASNTVTAEMIAKRLGITTRAVHTCLSKNSGNRYPDKVALVRKTAEEMGYDPKAACALGMRNYWAKSADERKAKAEAKAKAKAERKERRAAAKAKKEADYLLTHNFPSKEVETRRMLYLQSQGVSNADIGKMVGRSYQTVLKRIGKQAPDVTKANHAYAMKLRADKNAHRRLTAANHTVNVYNEIVTELEELKNRTTVLETKIEEIKPKLKDALKIATVEPMTISSDNNLVNEEPTVIQ